MFGIATKADFDKLLAKFDRNRERLDTLENRIINAQNDIRRLNMACSQKDLHSMILDLLGHIEALSKHFGLRVEEVGKHWEVKPVGDGSDDGKA